MFLSLLQATTQTTVAAVTTAAASASDNPSATIGLAVVVPFILQAFKNASWFPWLTRETARINFAVGIIAACATTFGIHATWDSVQGGTITIPGIHGLWQALIQWAGQQGAYKGLVVLPESIGDIRTLLERLLTPIARLEDRIDRLELAVAKLVAGEIAKKGVRS